ncbi:LysR family transcriptional regulator [Paenibacillus sp. NPDC058071]|uniref:LysR family transcriptional regulator n=1 Tax=Paenibacillus sp. NPDC058071 TaxID=3346326 RepID=UPI0036D9A989
MEFQQLKYFTEVASYLHFGRAADSLHVSQQTISSQIAQLESELGVQLFKRTTRKVQLTLAGEALLEEVQLIFQHLQKGIEEAKRAESGRRGKLVIGYYAIMLYSILPKAIRLFREEYPEVEIVLREVIPENMEKEIEEGEIDLGFAVYLNDKHSEMKMNWLPYSTESMVVALPKSHPLAVKKMIHLHELAEEPFIMMNRSKSTLLYDFFFLTCRQSGINPNIVQSATNEQAVIGLVAAGVGIALVPNCMNKLFESDIAYIPMAESFLHIQFAICWLRSNKTKQVKNFVEIVRSYV